MPERRATLPNQKDVAIKMEKAKKWIPIGSSIDEMKTDTGIMRNWVSVEALPGCGGFLVRSYTRTMISSGIGGASHVSETISSFIPAKSIDELRDMFFEVGHEREI